MDGYCPKELRDGGALARRREAPETVDWEGVWRRLQRAGPTTGGAARGQVSIDAALTAVVCGVSCEAVRRP